jgi:hypothetical protein
LERVQVVSVLTDDSDRYEGVESVLRRQSFGGYFQWVLDDVCETVEWPNQPLGFDSVALRSALDQSPICAKLMARFANVVGCIGNTQKQKPQIDNLGPLYFSVIDPEPCIF